MGIVRAIATLINAFPALAKFIEKLSQAIKEKNARENWDRKKQLIATDVRDSNNIGGMSAASVEWSGSISESPAISRGSQGSTTIHGIDPKQAGRI